MKKLLFIFLFLFLCSKADAATYYAINAGGNWTAGGTWSTISAKDATRVGGVTAPTNADTCYLDDYSGNVTINAASACLNIDENTNGAYGGTLAFGTQILTVSGDATLRGAMTNTSGTIIVVGNTTLAATPTGTFPLLTLTPTADNKIMTSGGFTWGGALKFTAAKITKLSGAWVNTGLVTITSMSSLNYNANSTETLTCNGGLTVTFLSGTITPTATVILGGGTWSGANPFYNNLNFVGNSTVSGIVSYLTGTMTYVSGTITTTSSTLSLGGSGTIATRLVPDTGGITFNNITVAGTTPTITLASNLTCTGNFIINTNNNPTFVGAYNISCGTLRYSQSGSGNQTAIFPAGQTLTVTTNFYINGAENNLTTIKAPSTTVTYLNYKGTLANQKVFAATFTYVNASGATWVTSHAYGVGDLVISDGSRYLCAIAHTSGTFATDLASGDWTIQNTKTIYNYQGGTLSNTSNIVNINANNIGGFYIQ